MQKKSIITSLILVFAFILIASCSQNVTGKEKTADEKLAEGNYDDTTTDHMVPNDYGELERNIDVLLQAGNMIGDRHYDELEASVNRLERQGVDVSKLREKLAKLEVAPRMGEEKTERKIKDLENRFAIIKQSNWQVSPEGYAEIEEKLDELEGINDIRVRNLREEFSRLKVGGQASEEQKNENTAQTISINRGCVGKGVVAFAFSPMQMEKIDTIQPIGLMIGGHVTPIDHGYYTANTWLPGQSREDAGKFVDVYAPASGIVTSVQSMPSEYSSSSIGDYRIVIDHTCTFHTIYIHVNQLSEKLQSIANTGKTIQVEAGEVWKIHTVDMFDNFAEPVRTQLLDKNVRQKGPRGGKIDYDIDGRLVGNWFVENTNGYMGIFD